MTVPARAPRRARGRSRRILATGIGLATAAALLGGCGGSSDTPELVWYINPDTGGQAELAKRCSTDQYTITTQVLPQDASQQRIQLARRLAAGDNEIDLMSLDPPFTAEFAAADFLEPIPEDLQQKLSDQSFQGAVSAATWNDQLVVAPFWSNTQVLWYRKSFVDKAGLDMSQPVTWDQIIEAASQNGGKIGVQANKYEGYVVWINALVEGAGGHLMEDTEKGVDASVTIDSPAGDAAAAVIQKFSSSKAAPADLSVSNEGTAATTFAADDGAFQLNWTFIWTYYGDDPVSKDIGYAMYPETEEGKQAHPPYGGIGIGVNSHTRYPDEAMSAVECITEPDNQGWYAVDSGNMPASPQGYEYPELQKVYPADLRQLFQDSVEAAAPRTVTPYWSDVSSAIQSEWHPPADVGPDTPSDSASFIDDVLHGRTLL